MPSSRIIILTGASSSGKSTLARLVQQRLPGPFLHVQLDQFIEMLPQPFDDALFMQMLKGFHAAVGALASTGNNLILDHVLLFDDWIGELQMILRGHEVLYVGVCCPLEELERREKGRDARRQGFARSQYELVHAGRTYDLMLDTSVMSPEQCADLVLEKYHSGCGEKSGSGFQPLSPA